MSINTKLLEEELTEFCRSESLSLDGLREIIEKHRVPPNNIDNPNNDYKFFLQACRNERITEEILRYLLKYFPNAVRFVDEEGRLALHNICLLNKNVTRGMVQLLIDAFPDSLHHENNKGSIPLHHFCINNNLDEAIGLEILKLLVERCPESVRHANRIGNLPIHTAAINQSPEFCRILIEAHPGSERMANGNCLLPFHAACRYNTVATAKYFYQLYPESINVIGDHGIHPIHLATVGRDYSPETAVEMTQFLLDCGADVALQKQSDKLPLYWVCDWATTTNENTPKLNAYLNILQILYDAHPQAIEDNDVTSNVGEFCTEVQTFLNTQLTYARQARDHNLINSPDENGQLPLHRALRDNVTLGSIKLLVKGNPSALRCADNSGMIPLHVACQHNESASIVEYLIDSNLISLRAKDFDDNTALQHACRGANHAIIALLLDKYGAMYVSKRNAHGLLPIDLLLQSKNEVRDEERAEYTESIYRLLRAYPMTLMYYDLRQAGSDDCISQAQSKKKRKVDEL